MEPAKREQTAANDSGTGSHSDARLTRGRSPDVLRVERNKVGANTPAGHILSAMIELRQAYGRETDPNARTRQVLAMARYRDELAKLRM